MNEGHPSQAASRPDTRLDDDGDAPCQDGLVQAHAIPVPAQNYMGNKKGRGEAEGRGRCTAEPAWRSTACRGLRAAQRAGARTRRAPGRTCAAAAGFRSRQHSHPLAAGRARQDKGGRQADEGKRQGGRLGGLTPGPTRPRPLPPRRGWQRASKRGAGKGARGKALLYQHLEVWVVPLLGQRPQLLPRHAPARRGAPRPGRQASFRPGRLTAHSPAWRHAAP